MGKSIVWATIEPGHSPRFSPFNTGIRGVFSLSNVHRLSSSPPTPHAISLHHGTTPHAIAFIRSSPLTSPSSPIDSPAIHSRSGFSTSQRHRDLRSPSQYLSLPLEHRDLRSPSTSNRLSRLSGRSIPDLSS